MIEYKVRPVTRFVVTRYEASEHGGSSQLCGEFDSENHAGWIAGALAAGEPGAKVCDRWVRCAKQSSAAEGEA